MSQKNMNAGNQGQTGPKTPIGKQISSQNACKNGIFVQGYLPWEDREEKEQQFAALTKQWRAQDPTRLMLLRSFEQSQLGMERLRYIEHQKIMGLMQSTDIAAPFCERANIAKTQAALLPDWFFLEEGIDEKKRALIIAKIYDEAAQLKTRYSDQLVSRAKAEFPALYGYVMRGQNENASFLMTLGKTYAQSTPTMNLTSLMNHLVETYEFHLLWAQAPNRYQTIIDGLRAEQMEVAMDFEKTQRYATNLHNRMLKDLSALAALDQHELSMKNALQIASLPKGADDPDPKFTPKEEGRQKN